eukprot:4902363-Prymnesium_polylepis.1
MTMLSTNKQHKRGGRGGSCVLCGDRVANSTDSSLSFSMPRSPELLDQGERRRRNHARYWTGAQGAVPLRPIHSCDRLVREVRRARPAATPATS